MIDDDVLLVKIGLGLRNLRKNAGFTSYENFAIEYDLSRSYYWKTEKGLVNISIKYFTKLLNIHDIAPESFFEIISKITPE